MENYYEGLPEKEIREFFATTIRKLEKQKAFGVGRVDMAETALEYAKENYLRAKEQYEAQQQMLAISKLLKEKGWKPNDVSDSVRFDQATYVDFIGTEAEAEEFEKKQKEKSEKGE